MKAIARIVHGLIVALAATGSGGQVLAADPTTQLPRSVRPLRYSVSLAPDLDKLTFSGRAAISIDVLEETDRITLNAAEIAFDKVTLSGPDAAGVEPATTTLRDDDTTATFTFPKRIAKGHYELTLDYTGRINTQAFGLFAIDYAANGVSKRALFTQLESGYARRVFPSWDEPSRKATFTLEALTPRGMLAVSNMPPASTQDLGDDRLRTRFAETPKMSTYLVFLAVGDFERTTARVEGTELAVVTRPGLASQAAFVLESSKSILREYNDYFGVPYALPKLDNVASPGSSQQFGAMENWGAILSFEHAMLLDPSIATQADTQGVFSVAAHEMAHQWFGNLVTMAWWDDLWLNEGFASWMESRTTVRLHPEWNTALRAVGIRNYAMERDALATTHPIVQQVGTVNQVDLAFDSITYNKAEAVIRMLEGYVGDDAWRTGVRAYIRDYAWGNAVSDDLWRTIEKASKLPVVAIARDFTLQPGVPLIRVESTACESGMTKLRLSQGEYARDRLDKRPLAWRVPVNAATVGGAAVHTLVEDGKSMLNVPGCGPVIVNAGQSGYFRTLYGGDEFGRIAAAFAAVAPIDQLGLLVDSWSLGLAGLQPVTDALELAVATPADADPQVWRRIAGVIGSIDNYYNGMPLQQARWRRFAAGTLAHVMARTGWVAQPGEAADVAILRTMLIETLGALGDPSVVAEARRRYTAREKDPDALPAALRLSIMGVVARHADTATWDELHAGAVAEKSPLVRDRYYALLAAPEDVRLAHRALELALTPEPGATMSARMISTVSRLHPDLAFDFALDHLPAVMAKVDQLAQSWFIPALADLSADPAMIGKINTYAEAHLPVGARREAETAAANVAYRVKVRTQRLPAIDVWLQRRG